VTQDNIVTFAEPGAFEDPLTEVLRCGARKLLADAIEAEVSDFLDRHSRFLTEEGQQRLVRHGHLPEREIMTGIGPVGVRAPRVRDRVGQGEARIRFSSAILPPYARRSKSLEVLIPILYLKGISTGDFEEALAALLGKDAVGLSASTVARLKDAWVEEHLRWSKRDLTAKRYVYFWVDGIYVQARLEDDAQCLLVIVGATPEGKKEFIGLADGVREHTILEGNAPRSETTGAYDRSRARGCRRCTRVLEGARGGLAKDARPMDPQDRQLNQVPKSQQAKVKRALEEIWMADTKKDALVAFDAFVEIYAIKYEKAVECLTKDREALLAFYDFPAEHWKHLRTSNPVESTFATVRHRTIRSKGCLSNKTALAMVFKLAQAAEKHWRRLDGKSQLPKVVLGVKFTDGIEVAKEQVQTAA
jgi:putative transposase